MQDFDTYVDSLEHLPPEFERNITLLTELDTRTKELIRPVNDLVREYKRTPSAEERTRIRANIDGLMDKMISYGTDKIEVVRLTYEMVEKQITALIDFLPAVEATPAEAAAPILPGYNMPVSQHEPKYCFCQQVSHGEMISCDNPECPIEWFHLPCVSLKKAPPKKTKWYCDPCQQEMKRQNQKPKKEPTRQTPKRKR